MKWLRKVENFSNFAFFQKFLENFIQDVQSWIIFQIKANCFQQIEPAKDQGHNEKTYPYCKKETVGTTIIACDNVGCQIEWFHVNCLELKNILKGKWYCPDCHEFNHGTVKRKIKKKGSSWYANYFGTPLLAIFTDNVADAFRP